MLYFIVTRGPAEDSWSKRGTISAKSPQVAERQMRRDYLFPANAQIMAFSQGYPSTFVYNVRPVPLIRKRKAREVPAGRRGWLETKKCVIRKAMK